MNTYVLPDGSPRFMWTVEAGLVSGSLWYVVTDRLDGRESLERMAPAGRSGALWALAAYLRARPGSLEALLCCGLCRLYGVPWDVLASEGAHTDPRALYGPAMDDGGEDGPDPGLWEAA